MKNFLPLFLTMIFFGPQVLAQHKETRKVGPFSKIIVSPLIDVTLIKGQEESVSLLIEGVSPDKVNVKNVGKTLRIFLDNARMGARNEKLIDPTDPSVLIRKSRYEGAKIKAVVTYKQLRKIEVRGESSLISQDRLGAEKLKIRLLGEVDANLEEIDTKKLKLVVYGDNEVSINGGSANRQVYRIFGESKINSTEMDSGSAKIGVFGDGTVRLAADYSIRLSTFGESRIFYLGSPNITKKLVLGEATISPL